MVYVLDINGKPLMPTERHSKVRRLLKSKQAKVVNIEPFVIQLAYKTANYTQAVSLGIDSGSKHVGISATTKLKELYSSEVLLRNDIVELISARREARSFRRYRKTRYRKPRFNNRRNRLGKLPPSIENKVQSHIRIVNDVCKILPINRFYIEVARFDTQLLKNSNISKNEYQYGEQFGFWNVREYVLFRDNYSCRICFGKSGDKILNVHHIESRKTGGDAPNNLITLCSTCHNQYHKGKIVLNIKRGIRLRDAAAMSIMRLELYNQLRLIYPNIKPTYGYITKHLRITNGLKKSHLVDARCISGNPNAIPSSCVFYLKQTRRHNRQIHKFNYAKGGVKRLNQAKFEVNGFRLFDKVKYRNQTAFIFGRRSSGFFDLKTLDGKRVSASASYKKIKLLQRSRRFLIERRHYLDPLFNDI